MATTASCYRPALWRRLQAEVRLRQDRARMPWRQQARGQSTKAKTDASAKKTTTTTTATQPAREVDAIPVPNTVATIPLWQRLGPLTRLAEAYARAQRRRPYVTQLCSSLVIYFCADISAQRMSGKEYTPTRTGRALVIGSISSIPSYEW